MRVTKLHSSTPVKRSGKSRPATILSLPAVAVCSLLGPGVLEANTRTVAQASVGNAIHVAKLRGTMAHLDEYPTMSARLAALYGDERWIRRYDEVEPRLVAARDEAVALAMPEVVAELSRTTNDASRHLIEMERAKAILMPPGLCWTVSATPS